MNVEPVGPEGFRNFIAGLGFEPPARIEPGQWAPFSTNGKHSDSAGRAKLFVDGEGGIVHDWRSGESWTWQAQRERARTDAELEAWREKCERSKTEAAAERERESKAIAERARRIWGEAKAAEDSHPYLKTKNVQSFGLRIYRGPLALNAMKCDGALIVPARNSEGELKSLSFISPNGEKRYLAGPRPPGCYFSMGKAAAETVCIAEGYATGATIYAATGLPVAIAFDAGNLEPTAKALRSKFPSARLILAADDDMATPGNPGLTKARDAARAVGGLVAIPDFGEDRPDGATDLNDLAAHAGADAVERCVALARAPDVVNCQPSLENRAGAVLRGAPTTKVLMSITTASAPKAEGARPILRRFSEIEALPIRWLWPGRIARGKVAMLAGNPGLGKSQATASMAAIVTRGGTWPVDRTPCELGSVIFLSAEDDPADTIRPRLEAAGADLSRCVILDAVAEGFTSAGDEVLRSFNLKTDLIRLADALAAVGEVAMVVIDPISAYLGGVDSHNNAEIRALLAPLSEIAAAHGTAIVAVSHLNKGGQSEALLRVTGSLAFVAASRSAWVVTADKEDPKRRFFLPMKNNLGEDLEGLAFSIQSVTIPSAAGPIGTSRVMWEASPVTITADEAMAPAVDGEERSATDEAAEQLREILSGGPIETKKARSKLKADGFTDKQIRRARESLGVVRSRDGFGGVDYWSLPKVPGLRSCPTPSVPAVHALPEMRGTNGQEREIEGVDDGELI